jgi:redox-sensing transcriptional repressor
MTDTISEPAKERFLQLLRLLEKHTLEGETGPVTSAQVERMTGWNRDTIRKDISCLNGVANGTSGGFAKVGTAKIGTAKGIIGGNSGYNPELLAPLIKKALGLDNRRRFCVVGLGRLGSAYLNFTPPELAEFELTAGFDTNVNKVEILRSPVPLYPAYKMAEVISRFGIEIALLCVPVEAAQAASVKCVSSGIRGILNFAPVALSLPPEIAVRNMNVTHELRSLAINMRGEIL